VVFFFLGWAWRGMVAVVLVCWKTSGWILFVLVIAGDLCS